MGVGEEQEVGQAGVGDLVAAGVWDSFDDSVHAKAAQVVGHLSGGGVLVVLAQEGRDERAEVTVGEAVGNSRDG